MKKKTVIENEPNTLPKTDKEEDVVVEPVVEEVDRFKVSEEEKATLNRLNGKPAPKPVVEQVTEEIANGLVTVQVIKGTVKFELGTFEQGDTFETTRERLKGLDQRFVRVV